MTYGSSGVGAAEVVQVGEELGGAVHRHAGCRREPGPVGWHGAQVRERVVDRVRRRPQIVARGEEQGGAGAFGGDEGVRFGGAPGLAGTAGRGPGQGAHQPPKPSAMD